MSRLDAEIDRLYTVPLSDFTAERNALARRAGADALAIRSLQKPTLAAWAVNQLYWQKRPLYDRLIERAEDLRATHNAAIAGRRTDLRGASQAHEEALEAALKATVVLLGEAGHPVTDVTRQAIATTLRSLPGDEPAGRLSRQLQPRGFEALAFGPSPGRVLAAPPPKPEREARRRSTDEAARTAARLAAAREAATAASRATREAEHVVRREEFEVARAHRDVEKAERRVAGAEEALRQAEAELADARTAAAAAARARDLAQTRAATAAAQLEAARARERRARSQLESMS